MRQRGRGRHREEDRPSRPFVPASFWGAVAAVAVAGASMEMGWRSFAANEPPSIACVPVAACCVLVLSASAGLALSPRMARFGCARTSLGWLALGMAVALISSQLAIADRYRDLERIEASPMSAYAFLPEPDGSQGPFGYSARAVVQTLDGGAIGQVELLLDGMPQGHGTLRLIGRLDPLEDNQWDRSRFLAGSVASVEAVRVMDRGAAPVDPVGWLRSVVLGRIDPARNEARALLAGIVCGRTTELDETGAQEAFSKTGTTHLVAVSGGHLALVSMLLLALLERLGLRRAARFLLLGAAMASYVLFTGASASAVRSLAMVLCGLAAGFGGRRAHALSGLMIAVITAVALQPGVVFDVGFQLSAASVLFLLLFARRVSHRLRGLPLLSRVGDPLAMTLVAQWATLPLTIPLFGSVSLVAPLANVLLGPLMSALLLVGLGTMPFIALIDQAAALPVPGAVLEGSAGLLLLPADALGFASIQMARVLAAIPLASLAVDGEAAGWLAGLCAYGGAVALYIAWDRDLTLPLVGLATCATALLVAPVVQGTWFACPEVRIMDVGQGDAILVRDGVSSVLIDCGVDEACSSALARAGIAHLDGVVISHWDRDHWGGLEPLLSTVSVGRVFVPRGASASVPREVGELDLPPLEELSCGDVLNVGGFTCTLVWPKEPVAGEDNEDSAVLDVRYARPHGGEFSILLTGDSESDAAEGYMRSVGDIDVLKLGHHGSKRSVSQAMLEALDPEMAVASAGEGNRYGHPSREAVELVRDHGARFLCTIEEGDISLDPGAF